MSDIVFLKAYSAKDSVLAINPKKAFELDCNRKKRAYVSFGAFKHFVDIVVADEIPEDHVLLSPNVINYLHLPDYLTFEICTKGNEVIIGPCIGMLISRDDKNITNSRLCSMLIYTEKYDKLHGAVIVFALNQVDKASRLIKGYCYNPIKRDWQSGIFPYPSAIYRTIGLNDYWKNHFLSVIGDKLFNNPYFNKWDMYRWLSSDSEIKEFLPYTILYQCLEDIPNMLDKFGKIFIKPVSGLKGHRIVSISKENKSTVVRYREKRVNQKIILNNADEIRKFTKTRFKFRKYLVQQAINLLKHQGSIIDFRCAVQKDQSGNWVCNAILGRCGEKGSIVSNISSGGTTYKGIDLLKKVLPSSTNKNILALKKQMEFLALKASSTLDEFGINCGTLGLDIGIDTDGHLWIIEINNRDPSPQYALDINDKLLYATIKTDPLFYAKALAGFKMQR